MNRLIADLESIIGPISIIFSRARATGHLDVPAPNNMLFRENNSVTLVWNLTERPAVDVVPAFEKIKTLADAEFECSEHEDAGIVIYKAQINWHGEYPDVFFRVIMSNEVTKWPNSTGNLSANS